MPMNLVIQKKRKELGLTQEQVAEYLNVSVPAVSKWEKGTTSPDISLLTPLARLLKTDLNTLLCFQKDMTPQEISSFCKEIQELIQSRGIREGFTAAEKKFREYPHSEHLLHVLTIQLDGLLIMSGLTAEETSPFDERITAWYRQLAESPDGSISSSANYMLAGHYIRREEYEKAQETLNRIPDRNDILSQTADKLMLQVEIYKHQGKEEKAEEELQKTLWNTLNKVQLLLDRLMDIELERGNIPAAKKIADKSSQMAKLFELWEFQALQGPLLMALAQKDAETCISILRKIPAALRRSWEPEKTLLFSRIHIQNSQAENVLSGILSAIKQEPFLKNSPELQALIAEYEIEITC